MFSKLVRIVILFMVLSLFLSLNPFHSFAYGPAPLNNVTVLNKIRENIERCKKEIADKYASGSLNKKDFNLVLFLKDTHMEAFKRSGYDFNTTISTMATSGFDKDAILFKEIILPFVYQLSSLSAKYSESDSFDSLYKIFPREDANNLTKAMLIQNAKKENLSLPDYNIYSREGIDSLLRNKWNKMCRAVIKGNFEEALTYIHSAKRDAYKTIFPSQEFKDVLKTIKSISLVDFNFGRVKYVFDFEAIEKSKKQTFGSYIIFERDFDGLWAVKFF